MSYPLPKELICRECPFCGKKICGINVRQVDYNYNVHLLFCKKRRGITNNNKT
jgi:hypothetical protein